MFLLGSSTKNPTSEAAKPLPGGKQHANGDCQQLFKGPDLDGLSIRVTRLDAAVSIANRRSADMAAKLAGLEDCFQSRLQEVVAQVEKQFDARVEGLVHGLVKQLLHAEHQDSDRATGMTTGPGPLRDIPLRSERCLPEIEESTGSQSVTANSVKSGSAPKQPVRKRVITRHRRPSTAQLQAAGCTELDMAKFPDVGGAASALNDMLSQNEQASPESEHHMHGGAFSASCSNSDSVGPTAVRPCKGTVSKGQRQPADRINVQTNGDNAVIDVSPGRPHPNDDNLCGLRRHAAEELALPNPD